MDSTEQTTTHNSELPLAELGYRPAFEKFRIENQLQDFEIGRVIAEHKARYTVRTARGEMDAEVTGNLQYSATGRADFPAVGDWVALTANAGEIATIHQILPRFSMLTRQAVSQFAKIQIIATNIDYAFVVLAVDRDFNINRVERYLTICHASNVSPVVVLTKTDLISAEQLGEILETVKHRIDAIPVIAISNATQDGYVALKTILEKGKTYCLIGSSGVGKSTLLNNLSGRSIMRTDTISSSTQKGRHVTSHRELIVLPDGGILIDNPGMREVGITDTSDGLETTFDQIMALAPGCKFSDCSHTIETGCAVIAAVKTGKIDPQGYENYLKLEREKAHFESTQMERRKKDKAFGKMVKKYKKGRF